MDIIEKCSRCEFKINCYFNNFFTCSCNYKFCQFCCSEICESITFFCPGCKLNINCDQIKKINEIGDESIEKKKLDRIQNKSNKKSALIDKLHKLKNQRIIKTNVLFVTNIPTHVFESSHTINDYFQQFGQIQRIVQFTKYTRKVFVTFNSTQEAIKALLALNKVVCSGRQMVASLGTSKYCQRFINNESCRANNCPYEHQLADPECCFSAEEIELGKHIIFQTKLVQKYTEPDGKRAATKDFPSSEISPSSPTKVVDNNNGPVIDTAADESFQVKCNEWARIIEDSSGANCWTVTAEDSPDLTRNYLPTDSNNDEDSNYDSLGFDPVQIARRLLDNEEECCGELSSSPLSSTSQSWQFRNNNNNSNNNCTVRCDLCAVERNDRRLDPGSCANERKYCFNPYCCCVASAAGQRAAVCPLAADCHECMAERAASKSTFLEESACFSCCRSACCDGMKTLARSCCYGCCYCCCGCRTTEAVHQAPADQLNDATPNSLSICINDNPNSVASSSDSGDADSGYPSCCSKQLSPFIGVESEEECYQRRRYSDAILVKSSKPPRIEYSTGELGLSSSYQYKQNLPPRRSCSMTVQTLPPITFGSEKINSDSLNNIKMSRAESGIEEVPSNNNNSLAVPEVMKQPYIMRNYNYGVDKGRRMSMFEESTSGSTHPSTINRLNFVPILMPGVIPLENIGPFIVPMVPSIPPPPVGSPFPFGLMPIAGPQHPLMMMYHPFFRPTISTKIN